MRSIHQPIAPSTLPLSRCMHLSGMAALRVTFTNFRKESTTTIDEVYMYVPALRCVRAKSVPRPSVLSGPLHSTSVAKKCSTIPLQGSERVRHAEPPYLHTTNTTQMSMDIGKPQDVVCAAPTAYPLLSPFLGAPACVCSKITYPPSLAALANRVKESNHTTPP